MPIFSAPLFTATASKNSYLLNQSGFSNSFAAKNSLVLPLVHDSEWHNNALDEFLTTSVISPRSYLSTQVKHIYNKPFCFFTDYAIRESGNDSLLPMQYDFVVQDYLKQFDIESEIVVDESETKYPFLDIWLYSFFGIVDITLLSKPDTLIAQCINAGLNDGKITHEKRLTTLWNKPVSFPLVIKLADINNDLHSYRIRMQFIDIGAIHGNASYKKVCDNVGIDTTAKSLMDDYKSDMLTGLKLYPDEYIRYANGDLNVYDVLVAYESLMQSVYSDLDLSDYFHSPKMTIGATVADIISAAIFKWQNISPDIYHNPKQRKSYLIETMGQASADYLRTQLVNSHKYLLGKIHGGRCRNNNPLIRYSGIDAIADYDIAGAYSSIMEQLFLFTGTPWFYDAAIDGEKTLKEFLRCHESDLDDWHYTIYASTDELLEYEQDFLVSWIGATSSKIKLKDIEGNNSYVPIADYKSGSCRIYKKEIVNTPITSDSVKWIRSLSKRVRDDLMIKLKVKSAICYKRKDKGEKWNSIILGELLISKLKAKRAEYKKAFKKTGDARYNSLQELFKLIINTTYGVMCSRYFVSSNVVVANNITQAIRLGVYLMEKGLNLQGAITDGCMGSLNKVVYPLKNLKVRLNNLTSLYLENSDSIKKFHIRLGALDNAKHISLSWNETPKQKLPKLTIQYTDKTVYVQDEIVNGIRQNNVNEWINIKSWEHLNNLFPEFDYLLSFLKIETKDVYDSYVYHGAANYELKNPNYSKYAMRGYSGRKGNSIAIEDNDEDGFTCLTDYDDSSIPQIFLSQLHESKVKKLPPFIKTKILKSKDYKISRYIDRSLLNCGDDTIEIGMPNYCSLSQYTYQTIEQHEKWEWAFSRLKRKYHETFEVFFTSKQGILDYDLMVSELCQLANSGCKTPINALHKKYYMTSGLEKRALSKVKAAMLRNMLTFINTESSEPSDFVELAD